MIFSPPITPVVYDRGKDHYGNEIRQMEYGGWRIIPSEVSDAYDVSNYGDGMVMHRREVGEVFIGDGHAHVADSMYRSHPLVFLREYVAESLLECKRKGVVGGLRCVDDTCVYRDDG
jgi:hypothetical protein